MNRKRKILTVVALVEAGNVIETHEHVGEFKENRERAKQKAATR